MSKPQTYRDVTIPDTFSEWEKNAQVNFLCNTMDRAQIANTVREAHGIETRDKPLFKKDELAEIAVQKVNNE